MGLGILRQPLGCCRAWKPDAVAWRGTCVPAQDATGPLLSGVLPEMPPATVSKKSSKAARLLMRFARACAWTCQNSSRSRRRNIAPPPPKPRGGRRALAGGEEQAIRLAGRDHHTRSVGGKSPAQSAQCCCSIGRRQIISGIPVISAMRPDDRASAEVPAGPSCVSPPPQLKTRIVSVGEFG